MSLNFQKINTYACAPVENNDRSYDLYSAHAYVIEAGDSATITTGIAVSIPTGYHARTYSTRAAESNRIEVSTFCSINHHSHKYQTDRQIVRELSVTLYNRGVEDYHIARGDLIEYLEEHQVKQMPVYEVQEIDDFATSSEFNVQMKLRNVKEFPGRVRTWFISMYKNKPEVMITKYTNSDMVGFLEEFRQTPQWIKSRTKLELEAKFLFPRLRDVTEKTGEPAQTPFERLKDDYAVAKAKAQVI